MTTDPQADPQADPPADPPADPQAGPRPARARMATRVVTTGRPAREPDAPLNHPIVPASTYVAGGELGYGRYGNPAWIALEASIGDLEDGHAVVFGSGMAAAHAITELVPPGGTVVLAETCYLGVASLLDRLADRGRLRVHRVAVDDAAAVIEAGRGADLVWLESPTNPLMEVADLAGIAAGLHPQGRGSGPSVVIDNTFATPILQRPLTFGADIVLHSATKALSGHSDALLGAVVVADPALLEPLRGTRTLLGAVPGALETYLVHRGLRTLALRVAAASASAAVLAERLTGREDVHAVRYPGWGSMLSIDLPDAATADAVTAALRVWVNATSLGGVESMAERRRRWPNELTAVPEGLVRMSVGIEDVEDLWADLEQALEGV